MTQRIPMTPGGSGRTIRSLSAAMLLCAAVLLWVGPGLCPAASAAQRTFATPAEAVSALTSALEARDTKALEAMFGQGSKDILSSGDPVADKAANERFLGLLQETYRLQEDAPGKVFLVVGKEEWPFPIPLIARESLWRFDTREGREEILARRIGRNELSAIQVCLAYVDAQRDYASKDRDGDGLLEYAGKFRSDRGKRDGLYWETAQGEEPSPLGPLLASAQQTGYTLERSGTRPSPYHGYYYRILTGQGKNAPGGAYDYAVKGTMLGGFALVAYPARYGASGIMTFLVNHDGVVYEKDLGKDTKRTAREMRRFDPDSTWRKVGDMREKAKE